MKKKKKEKKKKSRKRFARIIEKSGVNINLKTLNKKIFYVALALNLIFTIAEIIYIVSNFEITISYLLLLIGLQWSFGLGLMWGLSWLSFYAYIDVQIYKRRLGVEGVFPDFLQLASANIRAGMPIDQALWQAIRPNFGVLAKEMEDVAKQTMSGTALEDALFDFADKYDSNLLKRSVSLLVEGLNAGGEIGELLNRIATNIQDSKMMQKEMSASVTTYVIFIAFASIVAAPFLLALSSQLLAVIEKIIGSINLPEQAASSAMISFEQVSVSQGDFAIFATITLMITATLSAMIISVIRKGNIKAGLKNIPIFIFVTLLIYHFMAWVLAGALSGMI